MTTTDNSSTSDKNEKSNKDDLAISQHVVPFNSEGVDYEALFAAVKKDVDDQLALLNDASKKVYAVLNSMPEHRVNAQIVSDYVKNLVLDEKNRELEAKSLETGEPFKKLLHLSTAESRDLQAAINKVVAIEKKKGNIVSRKGRGDSGMQTREHSDRLTAEAEAAKAKKS